MVGWLVGGGVVADWLMPDSGSADLPGVHQLSKR